MTDPEPTPQPAEPVTPPAASEDTGYAIEPPSPPAATRNPGTASLGAAPLLDDVDDDADLTSDPEVERAMRGDAKRDRTHDEDDPVEAASTEPLSAPGRLGLQPLVLTGAGITLAAVVLASIRAESAWFKGGIAAAYTTLFHTATGAVALATAAHFQGRALGRLDLATARMGIAVAFFTLVTHVPIAGPAWLVGAALTAAGCGVYLVVLAALFRFRVPQLRTVAACHAVIALAMWGLLALHHWASDAGGTLADRPGVVTP